MTRSRSCLYRAAVPALSMIVGLALSCPDLGLAETVHEPWGGKGGDYFREDCPKGSYLVGVDGRYGGWVDRISPVCAAWMWTQKTFGPPTVGPFHGGRGGGQKQILCWGFGINNRAVQSWTIWHNRSDDHFVNFIHATCASLAPPNASGKWGFGKFPDLPRTEVIGPPPLMGGYDFPEFLVKSDPQVCPPGELGVGIHGRAGKFIDAIGLICGPMPVNPGAPATKMNPLAVAPKTAATKVNPLAMASVRDDMFTVLKPANGAQVAPGQVVLLVKPPKLGVPPVTVLEFRWLDAPPGQPPSYTVAVETPKLLQDYLVPQQSQPRNTGRWEVRARTAAQPTPGPWSLPAQFQVVLVQPFQSQSQPSSIQQTAPLPSSSVTQAPAQSSSAATQMIRPPPTPSQGGAAGSLMIRPRGVEEKEAGSLPAAPTKKP